MEVVKGESAAAAKAADILAKPLSCKCCYGPPFTLRFSVSSKSLPRLCSECSALLSRSGQKLFSSLRAWVQNARTVIPAAAGANSVPLRQGCDQLDQWLNNLQQLAKPSKKSIFSFGGLIACGSFCVLLLIVAIINEAFDLKATANTIFSTCAPLALVAGLGLAALKAWQGTHSSDSRS